ncbi:EamA-like transporter family [Bifidobacterium dolichotidis]|uniref:EamA-like transporter family n=1 Tax=Bifidobacterium dolichotidis TaxID=2306976 RepID=A0A430FQV0_9BIFI|nr:DMT family transporter [Bifidobacterium dolichotidis]RSX55222.1 EamA-like transporter family [Bifidobacterium dolichotidis]
MSNKPFRPSQYAPGKGKKPRLERFGRFGASRVLVGCLLLLAGGFFWGVNGTTSKFLLEDYGVTPIWLACIRELLAGVMFLVVAAISEPKRLLGALKTPRDWPRFVFASLTCVMLAQVAYLFSLDYTNPGTATVMQQLNLIMVLFYVCLVGKRWPSMKEVAAIVLAFAGVFLLVTGGNPTTLYMPLPGLCWGLLDALSGACLAIVPISLINRWGNFTFNGITFTLSGLLLIPFAHPIADAPHLDLRGWGLLGFTVIGGTFLAFWLFLGGVVRAGSLRTSLLSTFEPVVATVTAVVWMGTVFLPTDFIGFALILAMVVVMAVGSSRRSKKSEPELTEQPSSERLKQ